MPTSLPLPIARRSAVRRPVFDSPILVLCVFVLGSLVLLGAAMAPDDAMRTAFSMDLAMP